MRTVSVSDSRPGRSGTLSYHVSDVAELRRLLSADGIESLVVSYVVIVSGGSNGHVHDSSSMAPGELPDDLLTTLESWGATVPEELMGFCALSAVK